MRGDEDRPRGYNIEIAQGRFRELASSLKIDKDNLDEELVHQPELYHRVGDEHEHASEYRDEARRAREEIRAHVETRIRRSSQEKMTVDFVRSLVEADEEFREADKIYDEWNHLVSRFSKLRDDFAARMNSLRKLGDLWGQGYFQSNSVTVHEARENREPRSHELRRQGRLAERRGE